jgi:hypothetical protein
MTSWPQCFAVDRVRKTNHTPRAQNFMGARPAAGWRRTALGVAALCLIPLTVAAQDAVPTEVGTLDGATVTVHLQPFLTEQELQLLRLVATNPDALAVFVPNRDGFAAMAVSPDDGFIRDGVPVGSAVALSALPDAATAAADAIAGCEAKRGGVAPCVVVLDIAPGG